MSKVIHNRRKNILLIVYSSLIIDLERFQETIKMKNKSIERKVRNQGLNGNSLASHSIEEGECQDDTERYVHSLVHMDGIFIRV